MHIGFITYRLGRNFGGIGRYTVEIIKALSALENAPRITLLSAGDPGPLKELSAITWVRIPFCRRYPFLVTLGNLMLPLLTNRYGLDIVHDPNGLAPFLFSSPKTKAVLTLHDVFPWTIPGNNTLLDSLVYQYWLPRIVKRVSVIVTVSEYSESEILRYLPVREDRLRVIQSGVSSEFFPIVSETIRKTKARYGIRGNYILYVGSIERRKNIPNLLRSCQSLWEEGEERMLVLVGAPAWKNDEVMAMLEKTPFRDKIIVTGYVPSDHLPALYSGADIFVFPSIHEGFGLPPLEAMACDTPVVCANTTALPEVVGDAALCVDTSDTEQLRSAIYDVLNDSELNQLLRSRGLARASQLSWEKSAIKLLSLYEEILDE